MANVCKTCGGPMQRVGNYYVCEYCRNKWEIDSGNDIHAVDRANAWAALRDGDFEKAAELFENLILKDGNDHEAYWGRALANGGIIYVTDLNENKKVPTCNNITEDSFLKSKDVQKAISLAPADIRESYQKQAEQIEKIRIEWLEKASKEPAYDVFISFKDSDREHGIERTQDSIDAQDLYNALIAEGYKVFFSRISLRDKISEQYEPYIYNAIKTAKIMIVFGEKPEYFSAVWLKNEWSRFKSRIEKGEKHKNSLVVVYKNMNPGDLPVVLRTRQCLNAADMTFLSDLNRHIKRVIDESRKSVHIDKIKIEGGQIAKQATALTAKTIQTRQVGQGAIAETSIDEKQSLDLMMTYLKAKQWEEAKSMADDILFNNPGCAEAIWYQLLASRKVNDGADLPKLLEANMQMAYSTIEKVLDCASKDFAKYVLETLYFNAIAAKPKASAKLLETILPYTFDLRQKCIDQVFADVIKYAIYEPFEVLLTTLESSEVDKYIQYHMDFARNSNNIVTQQKCLKKVLEVNEGHLEALRMRFVLALEESKSAESMTRLLEDLLKFAPDTDKEVVNTLVWLKKNAKTGSQFTFSKQVLRYYGGELETITDLLLELAEQMIKSRAFAAAEYFLGMVMNSRKADARILWDLCLIRTSASTEAAIAESAVLLKDVPEYKKYLTLVDEKRRMACFALADKQRNRLADSLWKQAQKKAQMEVSKNMQNAVFANTTAQVFLPTIPEYQQLLEILPPEQRADYERIAAKQKSWAEVDYPRMLREREAQAKEDQKNMMTGCFGLIVLVISIIVIFVSCASIMSY